MADRLFQTVAEVCLKDRSAKAEWARFTRSGFWFNDRRFLDGVIIIISNNNKDCVYGVVIIAGPIKLKR